MAAAERTKPSNARVSVNFCITPELAERLIAYRLDNTSGFSPSKAKIMVVALTRFLVAEGY